MYCGRVYGQSPWRRQPNLRPGAGLVQRVRLVLHWPIVQHHGSLIPMPREDLPFCDCQWLERAAHDVHCPVEFDSELNEYNFKTADGGSMRIYHCPFCAGRAPASLRARLFAEISHPETSRLHRLTKGLKTEADVLAALGEPTHVFDPGIISSDASRQGEPARVRSFRSLRYDGLSDTATINVTVKRDGKASISFSGKYIGSNSA